MTITPALRTPLRPRRAFITTGLALIGLAVLALPGDAAAETAPGQAKDRRSGGRRPGGTGPGRNKSGRGRFGAGAGDGTGGGGGAGVRGNGSGKPGPAEPAKDMLASCDAGGKAPVRLILDGRQSWMGAPGGIFEQPGGTRETKGPRAGLRSLPLAALPANSRRRWQRITLVSCNGSKEGFDTKSLTRDPNRYFILETRRKFLKLVERSAKGNDRTLLRDIRRIEMR